MFHIFTKILMKKGGVMNVEQFKVSLEKKKNELVARLESLDKDRRRVRGAISQDFAEQAVDVENDEVVDHLSSLESNELAQVNAALLRIEKGQFGICVNCGAGISEKRLLAVPFSSQCVNCAG